MLLVVLLSPKMLNAGNTFAGGQPFSGLLRAGFITLGVRKIKIVPLSQKHAQKYTHTHTHAGNSSVYLCVVEINLLWQTAEKKGRPSRKTSPQLDGGRQCGEGTGDRSAGRVQMCCALFVARASPCRSICLHNQSCYPCFAYPLIHTRARTQYHTYRQAI